MKKRVLTTIGVVAALSLVLTTMVSARPLTGQFSAGTGTSTIALMNIDPAGQAASYVVNLYGQDGSTDGQISGVPDLAYRGEVRYDLGTYSLPFGSGWSGSAVVSSNRELAAIVDQRYEDPAYHGGDDWNGGAYGSTDPATEIYMPYITQVDSNAFNDGRWSRLTIQNTSATSATVYINYYSQGGLDRGQVVREIGGLRSYTWEPEFTPDPGENRSAYITSTVPVVAVFDGFWTNGFDENDLGFSASYESIPGARAGNTLIYPSIFRVRSGLLETGDWIQWCNIFVQNTSLIHTANITVTLYKTGETAASMTFIDTIPANSSQEYNSRFGGTGGFPSGNDFRDDMGAGFYGSAIVESDQPIVGVAHNFWYMAGSTYAALTPDEGTTVVYSPLLNRQRPGGTWQAWNKIAVSNVDVVPAKVYVYFYEQDGTVISFPELEGIDIAVGSADAFNTRFGTDSGHGTGAQYEAVLGNDFVGGVMVTSTAKIVGINNIIYPNRINTTNTFPEPGD